jgi:hypothetical protein
MFSLAFSSLAGKEFYVPWGLCLGLMFIINLSGLIISLILAAFLNDSSKPLKAVKQYAISLLVIVFIGFPICMGSASLINNGRYRF